jgi:hypothetical protein
MHASSFLVALALAFSALATAAPRPAATSAADIAALPPDLRPAVYEALRRDEGAAYRIGADGCATTASGALRACFDESGAHFAGARGPLLALGLSAYGRGGSLDDAARVAPEITGNEARYPRAGLTEWWRILPIGVEHGFTLAERPAGVGDLTFALRADHDAEARSNGARWDRLNYDGLSVLDADGALVPAKLTVDGRRVRIDVDDRGARYPLTVDPLVWPEQKVVASDGAANDHFGASVAIANGIAFVGAFFDNVGANAHQGSVYVFTKTNGVWAQSTKIVPSPGSADQLFGYSLAASGSTLVVGSYGYSSGTNVGQGAVYLFTGKPDGTWSQSQKLTASDPADYAFFGYSVAFDGNTVLVGAPQIPVQGQSGGPGSAYVFAPGAHGFYAQTQKLTASDGQNNDDFGYAVAIYGKTALIGTTLYTTSNRLTAAYSFINVNGTWLQMQKLEANDTVAGDSFGYALAIDGSTALIGAPTATIVGNVRQGAAYVFTLSNITWVQSQKLIASDGFTNDEFGWSIGLNGVNAVIGARDATVGSNTLQGAAYGFGSSQGVWTQNYKFTSSDGVAGDGFGVAVARGAGTALIGAPYSLSFQGSAYFYTSPFSP